MYISYIYIHRPQHTSKIEISKFHQFLLSYVLPVNSNTTSVAFHLRKPETFADLPVSPSNILHQAKLSACSDVCGFNDIDVL